MPVSGPSVLEPLPGFEYHTSQNLVNKHFFVEGVRVASSAVTWTAPLASMPPVTPWWSLPEVPPPPGWAVVASLYGSLGVLLLGAALRRRKHGLAVPALRLRAGAAATLLVVSPALLASPCSVQGPPPVPGLGTHTESVLFYATDHLGSTILTVEADGTRRNRFVFMPYGDPGAWQEGDPLRHRFAGEEVMAETGFYILGARVYDPELGRFLQPDPLVGDPSDPQSFNRYTYARNNPLSWVDPSGLTPYQNTYVVDGDAAPAPPGWSPRPKDPAGHLNNLLASATPAPFGVAPFDTGFSGGRGPGGGSLGHPSRENAGPGGLPLSAPSKATHVPTPPPQALVKAVEFAETVNEVLAECPVKCAMIQLLIFKRVSVSSTARGTEVVQRAMSRKELQAIQESGVLSRGGRAGPHHVSDAVNSDALRARQRLSLPQTPEVRATLEVPGGVFSPSTRVRPNFNMSGGGMERTAPGELDIPVRVLDIHEY